VEVAAVSKSAELTRVPQETDFKEYSMYANVEKLKSVEEAVKKLGRL
jgi:hypothetical protein